MRTPVFLISIFALTSFALNGAAAEPDTTRPFTTFKSTRLMNAHSVETLLPSDMDFRIVHRFGDMAGSAGGIHSLFGIDEARDIRIGLEYGLAENLMIGLGRSKGAGPTQEIFDGFLKYRFLQQNEKLPFSAALLSSMAGSIMEAGEEPSSPTSFDNATQRLSYFHQLLIASRVSDRLSLQLMPSYSHRNFVSYDDKNSVFGAGLGAVFKLNKKWGIVGEYHYLFQRDREITGMPTYDPISIGVELETGGHVFHVGLSNSGGIGGNQFIPHTSSNFLDGEFRFGFTISRLFHL